MVCGGGWWVEGGGRWQVVVVSAPSGMYSQTDNLTVVVHE